MKIKFILFVLLLIATINGQTCEEKKDLDFYGMPECKNCLEEIEKYIAKEKISFPELEEYKLILAENWESCNKLKTEIKNINCESLVQDAIFGTNIDYIYELQTECYFQNSKLINKISEILNQKNLELENNGIEKIKETELFDFYSKINYENYSIKNEIDNQGISGYILNGNNMLNNTILIKKTENLDIKDIYKKAWESEIIYNYEIPIEINFLLNYASIIFPLIPVLLNLNYLKENITDIGKTNEFLNSDLSALQKSITIINGKANSANSKFLETIKEYYKSWEKIEAERNKLMQKLSEKKETIRNLAQELDKKEYYYIDREFIAENYEQLGLELKFSMQDNEINSFSEIQTKSTELLGELTFTPEKIFEDLVLLEKLNQKADSFIKELEELKESSMETMKTACIKKAKEKEKEYEKQTLEDEQRNSFEILKTKTLTGNLEYCELMLELIEEIESENTTKQTMHTKCIEEIENIVEKNNLIELLDKTEQAKESLDKCMQIKEEIEFSLKTNSTIGEIEDSYSEILQLYAKYEKAKDFSYADNTKIEKEFLEKKEYFTDNLFDLTNYSNKEEIKEELEEYKELLEEILQDAEENKFCSTMEVIPLGADNYTITFNGNIKEGEIICEMPLEIEEIEFYMPILNIEYGNNKIKIKTEEFEGKISFLAKTEVPYTEKIKQEILSNSENALIKTIIETESDFPRYFSYNTENLEALYVNKERIHSENHISIILEKGKNVIEIYETKQIVERELEVKEINKIDEIYSEVTYLYTIENKSNLEVKETLPFSEKSVIKDKQGKIYKTEITLEPFQKLELEIKETKALETNWENYKQELKTKIQIYSPENKDTLLEEIENMIFSNTNYERLVEISSSLELNKDTKEYEEMIEKYKEVDILTAEFAKAIADIEKELEEGDKEKLEEKINDIEVIIRKEIAKRKAELEGRIAQINNSEEKDNLYTEYYLLEDENPETIKEIEELIEKIEKNEENYAKNVLEEINLLEKEVTEIKESSEQLITGLLEIKKANPKTILPVNKEDIEEIKTDAEKILDNKEFVKKTTLEREIELKNYETANTIADSLYTQLEKDKKEKDRLKLSLETARNLIKERAIEIYNIYVKKQDILADTEVLEKSNKAIKEEEYLKALGYLSLAEIEEKQIDWFSFLLPLAGITGFGAYFFMQKNNKTEKPETEIPDNELERI